MVSYLTTSKIRVRDTTSGSLSKPSIGDLVDAFWEKDKCYYPGVIERIGEHYSFVWLLIFLASELLYVLWNCIKFQAKT